MISSARTPRANDLRYQSAARNAGRTQAAQAGYQIWTRASSQFRAPSVVVSSGVGTTSPAGGDVSSRARRKVLIATASAIVISGVALASYVWLSRPRGFNLQHLRISQVTDSGTAGAAALSPVGRYVAYALHDGAQERQKRNCMRRYRGVSSHHYYSHAS